MTGATGFLGAFLLHRLLTATDATVHCLVRASGARSGAKRLHTALEQYGLWDNTFTERTVAVPGDLAQERLGLSDEEFRRLAREMDAVFHAGASVNLTQSYEHLKNTNVRGTVELLRLAAAYRTVPLHHISTVGVYSGTTVDDARIRPEAPLPAAETLWNGYAQSKWAAEVVLGQARERGLPVSVYRPTRIGGDTRTGLCQPSDYLWLLLKGCVEAGLAPMDLTDAFDLIPVDHVSDIVVELSRLPHAAARTFNLASGQHFQLDQAIAWLCDMGYSMTGVPLDSWRSAIARNDANVAFPLLSVIPSAGGREVQVGASVTFDTASTWDALKGQGNMPAEVGREYFAKQVHAFVRAGFLPPPC